MDGVLFDSERVYKELWEYIARQRGITLPPDFAEGICGLSGEESDKAICRFYQTDDASPIRRQCLDMMRERMEKHVPIKTGVAEMLMYLKEKSIPVAVASGSNREQVVKNLFRSGLADYIDVVVGGNEVVNGKPDPYIFCYAAELIGQDPRDCMVFEDSLNGVRAGAAAGARVIMIPDLVQPTEEIRPLCYSICPTMHEALAIVRGEAEEGK